MLHKIHDRYIHKSHVFLFPLLGLKKEVLVKPSMTYLRLKGFYVPEDLKLLVIYPHLETDNRWKLFQRYHLLSHPMLESATVTKEGDEKLFIFNLAGFETDVHHFLLGRYSQFSEAARRLIGDFFGLHSPEWAHVQMFLSPQNFYSDYAHALGVEEELVRQAGELCPVYDKEKETLDVELPDTFWENTL